MSQSLVARGLDTVANLFTCSALTLKSTQPQEGRYMYPSNKSILQISLLLPSQRKISKPISYGTRSCSYKVSAMFATDFYGSRIGGSYTDMYWDQFSFHSSFTLVRICCPHTSVRAESGLYKFQFSIRNVQPRATGMGLKKVQPLHGFPTAPGVASGASV